MIRYKNKYLHYFIHLISLKYLFLPLILILLLTTETHSQFNTLIFKKSFHLNHFINNAIQCLGDQNGDGYDDFLIFDCGEKKSYIFFGGNPVDTIPKFAIDNDHPPLAIVDLNNDSIKDIVFYDFNIKKVKVYYGGAKINLSPDLIFNPPPGSTGFGIGRVLKDFNGDGRSELVLFDPNLPYSEQQMGSLYFYNAASTFDTIPHYVIYGDTVDSIRIYGILSSGDINNDCKTDFNIIGNKTQGGSNVYFINFYLGNTELNLKPAITYYQNEHSFDVRYLFITKDLNKDGADDIIIKDYGFYPYYYYDAVLKGSFPIDTIPAFGLNTQNEGIQVNVVSLGDVNGDGFNDFMSKTFGFTPNLKLWVGGRKLHEVADKTWYGTDPGGFGSIFGAVGDINKDGLDDIAIGEIYTGALDCDQGTIYIFNGDSTVHADTITSINGKNINPPTGYKLNDPYPNPFNPNTVISYSLPSASNIKLVVFNTLGQTIKTLESGFKNTGNYSIDFNAKGLASGIYLYRLEVIGKGNIPVYTDMKKMILLK
jgi:hypothetical protein